MTSRSKVSDLTITSGAGRKTRTPKNICIFSHFDKDSIVRRYVFEYVEAIVSTGFAVMFVSTADRIDAADRRRLEALGIDVHTRENRGLDFGSWQYGLERLGATDHIDRLILANDSVFGPFFDLAFMFDQMNGTDANFWGVTDSYEGNWHLQSYFLCFDSAVVNSDVFRNFFRKDFHSLPKHQVINQGEIALSQDLLRAGFSGAASCPYGALTEGKFGSLCNPTQHYWDELIEDCRCPFLKLLLLRENPNGVQNLDRWRQVITGACDYDITMIEEYLDVYGEAPRDGAIMSKVAFYIRQLPYAIQLAVRSAIKACRNPKRTVLALEQYLATDLAKPPLHPGRRPTLAYPDLGTTGSVADPVPADTPDKRRSGDLGYR